MTNPKMKNKQGKNQKMKIKQGKATITARFHPKLPKITKFFLNRIDFIKSAQNNTNACNYWSKQLNPSKLMQKIKVSAK